MRLVPRARRTAAYGMRRGVALLAALVAVALTLTACGSSSRSSASAANSASGKKIGIVFGQDMVSRWKFDRQGFVDGVKAAGDTPVVVSAQSDAQKERGLVENMLTQGVDAMVITPVDINTAGQLFKMAKDAGVPTVDYNFVVPNSGADYVIARDSRQFGRNTAEQALKDHPGGNYVIVSGDEGSSVARDTQAGYMDVLQPEIDAKRITIVSQQFNKNWDPQSALQQTEQALVKARNAVDAVLVGNDSMAGGVMQALKAQNLLGKVFVSGIDADLANVQAIAHGQQSLTIWTDFTAMGEAAAKAADAAARQKTLTGVDGLQLSANAQPPTVTMPTVVVDKSNICEWTNRYKYYTVDQVFGADAASCK
jgi:D-xylose transport system substrate-binding protein